MDRLCFAEQPDEIWGLNPGRAISLRYWKPARWGKSSGEKVRLIL